MNAFDLRAAGPHRLRHAGHPLRSAVRAAGRPRGRRVGLALGPGRRRAGLRAVRGVVVARGCRVERAEVRHSGARSVPAGGRYGPAGRAGARDGEESKRWFSMATDLLATSSLEGCFTHLNPAWERTLGWTSAELMSDVTALHRVHPSRRRRADAGGRGRAARTLFARGRLREPVRDQGRGLALAVVERVLRRSPDLRG
jgi:PAS domain-containing protein